MDWTGAPPPRGLRLLALGLLWLAGHQDLLEAGQRGQALTILRSMRGALVLGEFVENVLAGGLCLLHYTQAYTAAMAMVSTVAARWRTCSVPSSGVVATRRKWRVGAGFNPP
ncbi:MAG: hypothetical protein L0H73_16140 [Nitrococcus sp.]|nr:hypothetical protein [Nitrococcus sp.]